MSSLIKKGTHNKVSKANQIIEAKYKLTLREQKLFLYMVSMIEPHDKEFKKYSINIKDLNRIINPKETKWGNIYQDFKDIIVSLKRKVLVIREEEKEHIVNFINDVSMVKYSGEIEYQISETLKPYLLQLKKNFTTYRYENVVQLKSGFSIRIYELLKQYEKIGKRSFELKELRRILGIEKGVYDRYADFKRYVVLKAQKELGEKTDIKFTFEEIKSGRKVAKLEFFIEKNDRLSVDKGPEIRTPTLTIPFESEREPILTPRERVLVGMEQLGIRAEDGERLWQGMLKGDGDKLTDENALEVFFQEKMQVLLEQQQKGHIENPAGFLYRALQKDFKPSKPTRQDRQRDKQKDEAAIQKRTALERQKMELEQYIFEAQENICRQILNDRPSLLDELMEVARGNPFVQKAFDPEKSTEENYQSPSIKAVIYGKLREMHPASFRPALQSLEDRRGALERQINALR